MSRLGFVIVVFSYLVAGPIRLYLFFDEEVCHSFLLYRGVGRTLAWSTRFLYLFLSFLLYQSILRD